ncbi:transmembrane 9 superfamily member 2-like [Notothenia coriiceps]|uniref:Transmembrane 9 superfamily member 2-like n=1 Tax=Notothenia coriiceps TaxID=8208 RepID=A0A6I9NPE2_9TELE|nr:PREDICTED: transmembrane 9 superfamily member 2-like [Notothenia coriiceps]
MPVTWCYDVEDEQKFCNPGFPIGCYVTEAGRPKDACIVNPNFNEKDAFYIFNHVDITIHYHIVEHEQLGARLVAAKIEPKSFQSPDCSGGPKFLKNKQTGVFDIKYTYSVKFVVSTMKSPWSV